jgi:hypothetical protein
MIRHAVFAVYKKQPLLKLNLCLILNREITLTLPLCHRVAIQPLPEPRKIHEIYRQCDSFLIHPSVAIQARSLLLSLCWEMLGPAQ